MILAGPPCAVGWLYSPVGVYQNGGFWATPVHHVWPLLHRHPATRALACGLLRDFVSSVTAKQAGAPSSATIDLRRINEWVDTARPALTSPFLCLAPRSVRRPLLALQVIPGSLYRCGKSVF